MTNKWEKPPETEEEIKKFEEEHLTKDDQMRSEVRKNFYEVREDDNAEPNVRRELRSESGENIETMTAVINGHKVEIVSKRDRTGGKIGDMIRKAKIDNFTLSDNEAVKLFEKYKVLFAHSVDDEEVEVRKKLQEAQKKLKEQAIKDVLGE